MRFQNFSFKNFFGGLLFTIVPLAMIAAILRGPDVTRYVDFHRWAPAACRITGAAEHETIGNGIDRTVVVHYDYTFAGTSRTGVWESPKNEKRSATDAEIAGFLSEFRPGTETMCRVNPDTPSETLLRAGFPWAYCGMIAFASLFVAFGCLLTLSCFGVVRTPETWYPSPAINRLVVMGIGLLFLCVGAGFLAAHWVPIVKRGDIVGWIRTPCVVEASAVRTLWGNKGSTSHWFEARYAYEIGGKTFRSHAVLADGSSLQVSDRGASLLSRYAAGTRTTCLIDPGDPAHSALIAYFDVSGEFIATSVFLGGFALIGAILFASSLFEKKVKKTERLQKAGLLVFVGVFCAIWIAAGLFVPDIRIQGILTHSVWTRLGVVAFGVGITGLVCRSCWRKIEEQSETTETTPDPKIPKRRKKRPD